MSGVNGIEIKVGQVWRCRDGSTQAVLRYDEEVVCLSNAEGVWFTAGPSYFGAPKNNPFDLIELVKDVATADAKELAAEMLSDLGWHFRDGTWVQDGATVTVETPDSALAVQVGGSHYKDLAIQPIEYIHANKLGFCEGNVVKYITRHRQKHGADDIRKVIHYCQLLLELEYGAGKTEGGA